jgi:6-phosphofructokinase 1
MGPRSVNNIVNKGGTILKSARSLEFKPEGRKAHENLTKAGIDALVIGGDGTLQEAYYSIPNSIFQ